MEIIISFIVGIAASVATLSGDRILRSVKQKKVYFPLQGKYTQHTLSGKRIGDFITEFKYKKKNIFDTHNGPKEKWDGRIVMSEENPGSGSGTYNYKDRDDCGIHQIQYDYEKESIFVLSTNMSHGKEYKSSYVLKKI